MSGLALAVADHRGHAQYNYNRVARHVDGQGSSRDPRPIDGRAVRLDSTWCLPRGARRTQDSGSTSPPGTVARRRGPLTRGSGPKAASKINAGKRDHAESTTPLYLHLDIPDAGALEHLGYLLIERARHLRVRLTVAEAWEAWSVAPLSRGWELGLADVGRLRIATRRLIAMEGWQPEQVAPAMLVVAHEVCTVMGLAELAVAVGMADGLLLRHPNRPWPPTSEELDTIAVTVSRTGVSPATAAQTVVVILEEGDVEQLEEAVA